jgi:hypothetical protein
MQHYQLQVIGFSMLCPGKMFRLKIFSLVVLLYLLEYYHVNSYRSLDKIEQQKD